MANVTKPCFKDRYDNFIGGKFVAPVKEYFDNPSPVDGKVLLKLLVPPRKTLILL
jgi:aldehyde dehydrogenase (NAD+)/aldehyde dehydrogenase